MSSDERAPKSMVSLRYSLPGSLREQSVGGGGGGQPFQISQIHLWIVTNFSHLKKKNVQLKFHSWMLLVSPKLLGMLCTQETHFKLPGNKIFPSKCVQTIQLISTKSSHEVE